MAVHSSSGAGHGRAACGEEAALSWHRAREAAAEAARRGGAGAARRVPLAEAAGGTLAEDLVARVGVPAFDSAAMDGYAVRGPAPWNVVGSGLAGRESPVAALAEGESVEIATGAPVPRGTVSVLPYESARRSGDTVHGAIEPGRHVRREGEDTAAGTRVLPAGAVVTPAVLGLAASLAHDDMAVVRPGPRPRVVLLVSGDELRRTGIPAPGAVRDAVGPLLPGLVEWAGGAPGPVRHLADDRAAMRESVAAARDGAAQPEIVVVCGASSVGPADHLRSVLAELGAEVLVDGVACRPGHPQLLARLPGEEGRLPGPLVVGLPGNPYAALVAALTLLVPVVAGSAGRRDPALRLPRELPLRGEVHPHERDTRLVAVRIEGGEAVAVGHDRPGSLRGAALSDALAVLPPGWSGPSAELVWLPC